MPGERIQFRQKSPINTSSPCAIELAISSRRYRVSSDLRISRRSVSCARKTDATKRMKETVESESCKRFYFAWIFNIESRDFASRLLFIETFSSLDTVIDNRSWKEFFFLTLLPRKPRYVYTSPHLIVYLFSYFFTLIVCFIINYILIPSVKLIIFSFISPLLRNSCHICVIYYRKGVFFVILLYQK